MHILFLDTEGSGSTDRTNTHDAKIFALVVLLCSYLIYNRYSFSRSFFSMGTIDERAIGNLSLAVELTKNIEIKLAAGKDKKEVLATLTPKFLWVVKDFSLGLFDTQGKPISANDYLEDALSTTQFVNVS